MLELLELVAFLIVLNIIVRIIKDALHRKVKRDIRKKHKRGDK